MTYIPVYPSEEESFTPPTVPKEDIDAYFAKSLRGDAWQALGEEKQNAAIVEAQRWLMTLCWKTEGCCDSSTPYEPPVIGTVDYDNAYIHPPALLETGMSQEFYNAYVMATAELALALAQSPTLLSITEATPGLYVSDKRLGDLGKSFAAFDQGSVKYGATAPLLLQRCPFIGEIVGCWISTTWGRSRILSRC